MVKNSYSLYIKLELLSGKASKKDKAIANTFDKLISYYENNGKQEDLETIYGILDLYSTTYGSNAYEDKGIVFNLPRDIYKQIKSLKKSIDKKLKSQKTVEDEIEIA